MEEHRTGDPSPRAGSPAIPGVAVWTPGVGPGVQTGGRATLSGTHGVLKWDPPAKGRAERRGRGYFGGEEE